jgi:hypothetical protein
VSAHHIFQEVGRHLGFDEVRITFARYAELKHVWTTSRGSVELKLSDYVEEAPERVMESLATYLLSRAAGRKCPDGMARVYLDYARSLEFWMPNREEYLSRSRNSFYFSRRLEKPTLAWTTESPRRRLGFYFEALNILAVNKAMDAERVPRFVLEFVMYHELLHHVNAVDGKKVRRVHHTKSFREQERLFRTYDDAEVWLRRLVFESKRAI